MQYADFMAFLFPPHEIMTQQKGLVIDPNICLDACQTTTVPPYVTDMADIVRAHQWFLRLISQSKGTTADLKCFFGLQNPPAAANISDLAWLKGYGIRFMTLAYQGTNEYGGGFDQPDVPLTKRGEELIEAMSKAGIVLDLSRAGHLTARSALDFIRYSKLPVRVAATSTACYGCYRHDCCLPNDVLRRISDRGGLIGLTTITWLLHGSTNDLSSFFRQLIYLIQLVGEDALCLGTAGVYHHLDESEEEQRFKTRQTQFDPQGKLQARFPEHAVELNGPNRLKAIAYILPGQWTKERRKKIMGENLIQFLSSL